ncbi:acyl carrier protein [Oenococcus kitaharae]|uniref:Acyl carrier protein n=1 Tax=Oenococcus kitaharae DSM 17330 TaxID=1045004 RepID=G9WEV1_9LACO|nr:acyl carrier protein [Oenococcus kitaharae]EHN58274.1 Acyl carrier protein [Oenococcus kitaharae DSM 17330]OEY81547.1 acyl carrier protein [Oenococcus kitaharae]OEY83034.1 acyl carrier protein [Oenococcus kitaharae]OEY84421.1 acyl carrier protein [Oenococcus kitaharae]
MTQEELFNKVKDIIADQTGEDADKIQMTTDIKNDLDADSLDVFEVMNEIEDQLDVKIEVEEGLNTVGDLVDFVSKQLVAKKGE